MNTKLLLPVYDDSLLSDAIFASHRIGQNLVAILNPNSGPKLIKSQIKSYRDTIETLNQNHSTVLGYIDLHEGTGFTGKGPRKLRKDSAILAEIEAWNDLAVFEYFLDDAVDWKDEKVRPLIQKIQAYGINLTSSWLNPGAPAPALADLGTNLIVLEDTTSKTAPARPDCGWIMLGRKTLPAIPPKLGAFFATNRAPSSAFQVLPTYWHQLLSKFQA
jgi:hypothetical protein